MDWSVGAGYSGLYTNVNKRESAKQDLATLSVLSQEVKKQKAEQEQAQLKEQAYYAEISKMSDTLLASDRNKINAKAKDMSSIIRNHLKQYGGDMTKFFENGGHKIMGDYKNAIVNSEEASQYMENKKNMEHILDMQKKGFGHLINPTDMFNMQNYQKNGGGKITYTGMLSEIKMPDPNSEIWGKEITVDRILSEEGNYTKIYANYKLTYPDAPEPTQQDLKQFTAAQYSGMIGTNWQKPMADRKAAYDEYSDQRNFAEDVHKDERNFEYGKYRDEVGDYQWQKGQSLAERKQDFEEELALIEMYGKQGGAQKSSSSSTGYVDSQGNPISKEDAAGTNSFMYDTDVMTQTMNNEINSINDISSRVSDIYKAQFGADVMLDNTEGYRDDSALGTGGFWKNDTMRGLFNNMHRLKGSKLILNGQTAESALKSSGLFKMAEDGSITLDLSQNPDMFGANGVRVKDWSSDGRLTSGSNFGTGENFADEISKTKFKVKGVVTGFTGKDKERNDVLITDIGKHGDGNKFAVKDKDSKEWAERMYDKKGKPLHGMFVVIQNEKGQTFYKPLNNDLEKSMMGQFAAMNVSKIKAGKKIAAQEADARINKMNQAGYIYRDLKRDPNAMSRIRQQVQIASGNPNTAKFDAAAVSFYTHLKNQYDKSGQNVSLDKLVEGGTFYKMLQSATDAPEEKQKLNQLLKNPKAGSYDFINFIIRNTEYDGAQDWINTLKYVETVKYKK